MNTRYLTARFYYADGSARNAEDPHLPKIGVIAINQYVNGARRTLSGHDFYWLMGDNEWCGGDRHGCDMYLMQSGMKCVYFGININTHIYNAIMKQVHEDPDFPKVKVK